MTIAELEDMTQQTIDIPGLPEGWYNYCARGLKKNGWFNNFDCRLDERKYYD